MSDNKPRILADYRVSDYSISTVDLTFELSDTATIVTNKMKVINVNGSDRPLILDGENLKLISISIDNQQLTEQEYQLNDKSLQLSTPKSDFSLTIVTEINPQENTALEGLFKSGGAFCTQCEAEGFRRISYYLDRPDVMAKFTTKIIANKEKYPFLLSNGNKVDEGVMDDGKHFCIWEDPFLKPCYLFALVAGDFDLLTDNYQTVSGRNVVLEIFVDKGNLAKAEHAMTSLKKSMQWDEDTFGLEYDLDIYMIVAVDFFNMGAMENKGLNVFNSKFVLADQKSATDTDYFNIEAVIAHEYFHNWTGNRVTCRDWFQLSLKEGLTVFRDQQFSGDMHSSEVTRIQNVRLLRAQQFAEDAGPMSHPIRPEKVVEMNNFYTLTVYEKGAEVIRMIHTLLGKDKFRRGMDLYFKRFDGMAVTCDDFVDAMADGSGIDLTQFKHWYSQSGTPELVVTEVFDQASKTLSITVEQKHTATKAQANKLDLHIPIKIELIDGEDKESKLLQLKDKKQTWQFKSYDNKPIVAFLSDFSAPVKVTFEQSYDELETLMVKASDAFNRSDAGQKLVSGYVISLVKDNTFNIPERLIKAFETILLSSDTPAALKAEQLTLPTFDELMDILPEADPIIVLDALRDIKLFLAKGLNQSLSEIFHALSERPYCNDGKTIGERALKNVCLSYLTELAEHNEKAATQFKHSDNMTDSLAALVSASKNDNPFYESLMSSFEQQWQDTTLVMDKWFSIHATWSDERIFEHLNKLEQHTLFSLKNPNRARSLIGSFAQNNPRYFHCHTGRGYQFLAKNIKLLNDINPQVASRLITPLIQFKRYDLHRQKLIKNELESIKALPNLSKDLAEKLEAAL